ncbi:TetR/AcrR family transcriptional regulator [Lactococcus allomyrinae]|uniref:TetR/AcrR family transcriptional regulator n=1 Tax=Lactococcus allomyrinae TaxID=2419773 RepID=A0A387BG23_9LACT|nr:TetR/AcrR family transcriptional regulator [Lactococcus allomyrinae]AYG00369.1 TetR/AcrR family transcriptional regulator [Lactococcus allomyrinae]
MAKDTKQIVIQALLNIMSENGILNLEEITRRTGVTRNTIQKNFNNQGIDGIFDFIYSQILTEINDRLFQHDPNELPIEIFADIVLNILWKHRDVIRILSISDRLHQAIIQFTELSFPWIKKRYELLVKINNLSPIISPKKLYSLWNNHFFGIISIWLSEQYPVKPCVFKPKFCFLIRTSMYDLIYKDIK